MSKNNKDIIDNQTINNDYEQLKVNYDSLVAENVQILSDNERLIADNEKLSKTVDRLQSSADNSDKYRDQLVALKSDFDSFKRRMREGAEDNKKAGQASVVEKILPILDTFAIAKSHLDGDNLKAFEMIECQFEKVLSELGVEKVNPLGAEFDVNTMNALSSLDRGEENAGKVVEVYKAGYIYDGKVLRYAEVIVGGAAGA